MANGLFHKILTEKLVHQLLKACGLVAIRIDKILLAQITVIYKLENLTAW